MILVRRSRPPVLDDPIGRAQQQQIGAAPREQSHRYHARDPVDRIFQPDRIADRQPVHIQDLVPDVAIESGQIASRTLRRLARKLGEWTYQSFASASVGQLVKMP